MFKIIDEASVSKTGVRFVELYQFVLVKNFNDKKTVSDCIKLMQKQIKGAEWTLYHRGVKY
jgi:uncharacterized cysteine cluster protein YcgN (CxxCxxCC family)